MEKTIRKPELDSNVGANNRSMKRVAFTKRDRIAPNDDKLCSTWQSRTGKGCIKKRKSLKKAKGV